MDYLKSFTIASSWAVTLPFFYGAKNLEKKRNYSYYKYTILAPLWLGLWSIISFIIAKNFKLSMRNRFLLITPITYLLSIIIVKTQKSYNYTQDEWNKYYILLFIGHFVYWNVLVYNIENLMS